MERFNNREDFERLIISHLSTTPTLTAAFILNLGLTQEDRKEIAKLYNIPTFSAEKIFKSLAERNDKIQFHDKEGTQSNKVIYLKNTYGSSRTNINIVPNIMKKYILVPKRHSETTNKIGTEDVILLNKLNQYKKNHCPNEQNQNTIFEQYVISSIIENDQPNCFENNDSLLDAVCVNSNQSQGISGLCLVVNGKIIDSQDYIDSITEREHIKNVEVFFIQSTYKTSLTKESVMLYTKEIEQFFETNAKVNRKTEFWLKIKNKILNSPDYWSQEFRNIKVHIFYFTPNSWNQDNQICSLFEHLEAKLNSTGFLNVEKTVFINRNILLDDLADNELTPEPIKIHGELPLSSPNTNIGGIATIIKAEELLKILTVKKTSLFRTRLFDKNPRDYQGKNPVNEAIEKTIEEDPASFLLRNNGITILVSEYTKDANGQIYLKNPQIVNGCQTCYSIYLLFKKGNIDLSKVEVFVKIIKTDEPDTINNIVIGNNRQTPVDDITRETMKEFHQNLEKFFNAKADAETILSHGVRYERRSNSLAREYGSSILPYQKCKFRDLLYSTLSVWFDAPYRFGGLEESLLNEYGNSIFLPIKDTEIIYYASAAIFSNYERLCFEGKIDSEHKRCKPQIAFILRYYIDTRTFNVVENPKLAIEVSKSILNLLENDQKFEEAIAECLSLFDKAKQQYLEENGEEAKGGIYSGKKFNSYLLATLTDGKSAPKKLLGGTVSIKRSSHMIILDSDGNTIVAYRQYSKAEIFDKIEEHDYVIFERHLNSKNKICANNVREIPIAHI